MNSKLATLAALLREQKDSVVARWKAVVGELAGAAGLDASTLRDHIPQFLDEMITAIASRKDSTVVGTSGLGSPLEHGLQRLAAGFNIKEVVVEYNILRSAVLEVAEKAGLQLTADECRVVNRIIDDAVAGAVDIFARKQAAELLRQRDEHLAFIVHDVRVPLNAIGLIATLLSEELGPDAREPVEMLQSLQRNVDRIEELVHQILQEDRNQRPLDGLNPVRREFDLWPLVQQLVQTLQPIASAAQVKIRNLVPRQLTLNADAVLLARALQNIVSNAIKFAPNGDIEIGAIENAAGMECWVKDNGAGIAPEHLESIFDKHETDADPLRAGFGLGLAIFKQVIEAHGGKITVQSQPGQGATFRFSIPKAGPK
ncbi:MAG TPA: sensor histidine kinase [Candidatus Sulfotelmatobacter sp.]|jgi:signal transduction histidine kinase|nr:sensor histidine kinase [Candidatus Sulfotelmatobacter sp.]